jgi:hypothetical protein
MFGGCSQQIPDNRLLSEEYMLRAMPLIMFGLLVACGSRTAPNEAVEPESGTYLTLLEAPPYPPIERLGAEPTVQTLEHRRWLFTQRHEERQLPLLRRIKREALGNFGGVEWRWREGPENGGLGELTGIVYFLREPENTLAHYTTSPRYRAAQADFARNEQDAVVRQWAERIGPDVASGSFSNMQVPVLDVALPRLEFERKARAEGWRLPRNLKLRLNPRAEPDLPTVSADLKPLIRAFPHEQRLGAPSPDIATFDTVVLRDGCFFIDEPGENDPLVEFPLGVGVYRDAEGHLAFRSRYADDNRRLGRVGTRLQLGYRSQPRSAAHDLANACKAEEIVAVTSADQAAGYGGGWFEVKQYRDRAGLSTAEAIRRANACLLAQEKAMADGRLRGSHERPTHCARLGVSVERINPPPPPTPLRAD